MGNIDSGKRRMLKSDSETKAISAFRTFFSSTRTNTANVTKATWSEIGAHGWMDSVDDVCGEE